MSEDAVVQGNHGVLIAGKPRPYRRHWILLDVYVNLELA